MELLIKEVLKRKGISVKELSQLLGVTRDACYKYINGNPTINVLDRIAKVLDVDVRSLINGRDGKEFRASNDRVRHKDSYEFNQFVFRSRRS